MGQHRRRAICGCGTYSEFPSFVAGRANYDHPRVSVNARLLDDFDVGALPVQKIDGKSGW